MRLDELFKDEPHGGKETTNEYGDFSVYKTIGGRDITFTAKKEGRGKWEIIFHEYDPKTENTSFEKTGSGDEVKVFSFVMNAFREFEKKYSPDRIQFNAAVKDGSRVTLYRRLIKRFVNDDWIAREFKVDFAKKEGDHEISFDFIRKPKDTT